MSIAAYEISYLNGHGEMVTFVVLDACVHFVVVHLECLYAL